MGSEGFVEGDQLLRAVEDESLQGEFALERLVAVGPSLPFDCEYRIGRSSDDGCRLVSHQEMPIEAARLHRPPEISDLIHFPLPVFLDDPAVFLEGGHVGLQILVGE